jgi:galactose-1-phosphate uridylyltransferase
MHAHTHAQNQNAHTHTRTRTHTRTHAHTHTHTHTRLIRRPKQTKHDISRQYAKDMPTTDPSCPFCIGNEHLTPTEVMRTDPQTASTGATNALESAAQGTDDAQNKTNTCSHGTESAAQGTDDAQNKTKTCSHGTETPPQDKPNSAPWLLRVIPNKFPAVAPLGSNNHHYAADVLDHIVLRDQFTNNNQIPALGFHEVIIESAQHNHVPATGSPQDLERLLFAMRSRC